MKKIMYQKVSAYFLTLVIILVTSCSPDNPPTNNQTTSVGPQPMLKFKGNGVLYTCNGLADSRVGWVGYPRIFRDIYGQDEQGYTLSFRNYKTTPSDEYGTWYVNFPTTQNQVGGLFKWAANGTVLNTGVFSNTDMAIDFFNLNYDYETNPGTLTVTINTINNGLASGTFSGTLPSGSGTPNLGPQMNITEGTFSNIPVFE